MWYFPSKKYGIGEPDFGDSFDKVLRTSTDNIWEKSLIELKSITSHAVIWSVGVCVFWEWCDSAPFPCYRLFTFPNGKHKGAVAAWEGGWHSALQVVSSLASSEQWGVNNFVRLCREFKEWWGYSCAGGFIINSPPRTVWQGAFLSPASDNPAIYVQLQSQSSFSTHGVNINQWVVAAGQLEAGDVL